MCGIVGFKDSSLNGMEAQSRTQAMTDSIFHRGPDHGAHFWENGIGLGYRRLKIIDLESGNQPLYNADGSLVVVYNGEIYNFQDLRSELIKAGYVFKTKSDTEVLVHGYQEWGLDLLPRLNGMFAFAIYDRKKRQLLLCRDRFGVKPLFYTWIKGNFYFSSELKTLTQIPGFDRTLDMEALSLYLAQMYIPQPWTIYKNARRLEAGHCLLLSEGNNLQDLCYHDLDFGYKDSMSDDEASERLSHLLSQSVRRQLVSDVPVGLFLSGGFDSSALLAMAMKEGKHLPSLTLSFSEKVYDENATASAWASFLQSEHFAVHLDEEEFIPGLARRQRHSAEPLAPWINVGREVLARKAAAKGLKVMFSGAGGDELFCGYPTLNAGVMAQKYGLLPRFVREGVISPLVRSLPAGEGSLPLSYAAKQFVGAASEDPLQTFFNFKMVFSPLEQSKLLTQEALRLMAGANPYAGIEKNRERIKYWPLVDQMQYLDFKGFLEGSILFLGDNATMAASIEERVPFLDNDLVDFAMRLPIEVKFRLGKVKPLLRRSLKAYLTSIGGGRLVGLCKKKGFELPGNRWAREGKLKGLLRDRLSPENLEKTGFFKPTAVQSLIEKHAAGRQNFERQLQIIYGLNQFLQSQM